MKRDLSLGAIATLGLGQIMGLLWGKPKHTTRARGEAADIKLVSARHAKE